MKKGSFLSDIMQVSLPLALAAIEQACKSKRKSKEKDEVLIALRDTLIARYPLKRIK